MAVLLLAAPTARSGTWPTSHAARHWHPQPWWLHQAFCIHRHESVRWFRNHTDWRGNWSPYSGGFQFLTSTWRSAGGSGEPWQWSPREQFYRAFRVWSRDGGSWVEWGTAGVCGV